MNPKIKPPSPRGRDPCPTDMNPGIANCQKKEEKS